MSTDTLLQWTYFAGHTGTAVVAGTVSYWVRSHMEIPGKRWFVRWMGNFALWSGVSAILTLSSAQPLAYLLFVVWIIVGLTGVLLTVCFATAYSGRDPATDRICWSSAGITALLATLAATGSLHGQYWRTVRFLDAPFPHFAVEPGVGWVVAMLFGVFAVGLFVYYFTELFFRSRRRQQNVIVVLIAGAALGFLPLLLSEMDLMLVSSYDHTSFAGSINAFAFSYVVLRFGTHSISTVARDEVVDHLAGPYVALDSQRRIVDFNEASQQLTDGGIQLGEPLKMELPQLSEAVSTPTGLDTTAEVITLNVDGEPRHWSVTVTELSQEKSVIGHVVFLVDVTDVEESKRLIEQRNEQLDAFAGTVSHDLRNPLHIAHGRLGLVQKESDNEHLDEIDTALRRMETLIDDLLVLARQGEQVGELVGVDLAMAAKGGWRHVETGEATLVTDTDRKVYADPSRLQQLFENLIRNATEHSQPEVTVTVGGLANGFFIEDNGSGIPEAERDVVFDVSYSTSSQGTGLGLNIVKQVVEAHGWELKLTEGTNGGARFEVTGVESVRSSPLPSQ